MQLAVQNRPLDATCEHHPQGSDSEAARIVQAAWLVLERSRFRSLKVRQVLLASNTSASNFYRHFASKSHLLLALLEDETARTDRQLVARLEAVNSAEGRLWAYLAFNIHIVHHQQRAERARLFLDPGLHEEMPEQVGRLTDVMGRRLVEIIRYGVASGVFRSADPHRDATMIQNLMSGLVTGGLMRRPTDSEGATVANTYDFVLRALGGPDTGSSPDPCPGARAAEHLIAGAMTLHSVH
jgi:AcrR family transcriptional regulator